MHVAFQLTEPLADSLEAPPLRLLGRKVFVCGRQHKEDYENWPDRAHSNPDSYTPDYGIRESRVSDERDVSAHCADDRVDYADDGKDYPTPLVDRLKHFRGLTFEFSGLPEASPLERRVRSNATVPR